MKYFIKNNLNRRVLTIPVDGLLVEDSGLKQFKGDGKKLSVEQVFFNNQVDCKNLEIAEYKEKPKKKAKEGDK